MINVTSGSAITILNAICAKHGAAIGISADIGVSIKHSDHLEFHTDSDTLLLQSCVNLFEKNFQIEVNVDISCFSNLPPARGMKTSSAISTSIIQALNQYYKTSISSKDIISFAAEASKNAGVSVTGAYDDAYASFFGGVSFYSLMDHKLISHTSIPEDILKYEVFLLIPQQMNKKKNISEKLNQINKDLLDKAYSSMMSGDIINAMSYNTAAYSPFLLQKPSILNELAMATETDFYLNGGGPSLFSLINPESIVNVSEILKNSFSEYTVVRTKFRNL